MTPLESALALMSKIPDDASPELLLIVAKCRGLMRGYDARWIAAGHGVEAVECLVQSELYNPDSERKSRSFTIAGRLDTILRVESRRLIVDHKTTSEDISDPNSPYWRQLAIEGQASHYMLLEWLNGRKADGAIWDVVRKPGISPKKLSKADIKSVTMLKTYCGEPVSDEAIAEMQATERETLGMYEMRLAQDCTTERPQWYFQRRIVPRLDAELHEYATELWEHSQELLHARRFGRHARNSGACMMYHSPCKFLGICSGHDTADSSNWQSKAQVHVELPELSGDGKDVLTNSRIRMFQTCRRKHYLAYEVGIERLDAEEREALIFGSIWHVGQSAWFSAQMKEVNNDDANGSPLNAGGTASISDATQETISV